MYSAWISKAQGFLKCPSLTRIQVLFIYFLMFHLVRMNLLNFTKYTFIFRGTVDSNTRHNLPGIAVYKILYNTLKAQCVTIKTYIV